jgi:ABC-type branched-subunit amino acid transport system ATPase component
LLKPMGGRIVLGDTDLTGWSPYKIVRQGMAYVPQSQNVFPSLSVVENLEMGAFARSEGVGPEIERVLAQFPDLDASRRKKAGNLSVGQRNLLGVARALMADPKVILVDEPTAGLAPGNVQLIWDQLVGIAARGVAVVVVEQNVDMALKYSEWCYLLLSGTNRIDGGSEDMQQKNLNEIFLGQSADKSADQSRAGG